MSVEARAGDLCDFYRKSIPSLYKAFCQGVRRSRPAGANSTFADGFKMNPAGLPTEPTGYGIETIGSYLRSDTSAISPDFSLIKGFHKIGTGVSTAGANTFYGNDILQRAKGPPNTDTWRPIEKPVGHVSNLNVGIATPIPPTTKFLTTKLGISVRYNKTTNTIGGGPGATMSVGFLSWGFGITQEKVSNYWPKAYFVTSMVSAKLLFLELEYNFLRNIGDVDLDPVHIVTASVYMGSWLFSAARRQLNYLGAGQVTQYHAAVQCLVSKRFSLGYLYNYVPGASSVAFQIYF